jgi:hypothetical protein
MGEAIVVHCTRTEAPYVAEELAHTFKGKRSVAADPSQVKDSKFSTFKNRPGQKMLE